MDYSLGTWNVKTLNKPGAMKSVLEQIMDNRHITIMELSSHVPQISCSLLHKIVTEHLLFTKLCATWVPKQLTPEHKIKHMESALTFLQRLHDDGNEFLDQIITLPQKQSSSQCSGVTVDLPVRRN
ncbi:hypothetical protein B7P43_G01186 [Cryptotermes secundus]|uniref:Uncharacterized protein n=1 Tax=Cryptotermes secundus TaxID=105785 RepID=A0A2J7QQZ6_9NEOP|nr:hypothetical protein B7P43_G01186 [Cryptotermes secundus]